MDSPPPLLPTLPERPDFPGFEAEIVQLWEKLGAFQESLKRNADKPVYTFYDGPPFATEHPTMVTFWQEPSKIL